jgi:predicted ATPase
MTAIAPQLARHFQAARLPARAVAYLQQAGERAASFGAYQEAIAHGNKALELLSTMPDTPERARAEYMVQIGLNEALKYGRSLAAPEAGRALARAYELAQRLDDPPLLCNALYNLYWFHLNRADIRLAMRFVQQLIALEERELPRYLPDAYLCLATDLFVYGDFPAARERLEALLAPDAPPVFAAGFESVARIHLAFALWCLGYPDQALQLSQRNLSLAYETEGPWAIAYALSDSRATFHQLRREVNVALEGAEQLLALTSEERWLWLRALGMILKGWAHAHEGRAVEGLAEMRQGLVDWRATGMGARVPHWLALLAEGYALAGRAEEGLGAIAEALEHVERTEERYYEAELYRLRGELLLKDEGRRACPERSEGMKDEKESSAEECFCKAIAVARRQVARLWELRATMSLCRLWQSQGKREEARQALAAIYGWFSEGFDTPDLQDAKALLGELAAGEEESAGRE